MSDNGNSHPPQEPRPETPVESLGGILMTARKRHGLTIEQVAAELRVESRYLEALEEDRPEIFAAPVFVKGYLRHLAKRFGLEYDSLLRRYTEQTDARDAPVTYSEPIQETSTLLVPMVIGALILVLGIPAFWFTWVSRDPLSDIISSDEESPPPVEVQAVPEETADLPDPGIAVETIQPPLTGIPDNVQPLSPEDVPGDAPAPEDASVTGPDLEPIQPAEGVLPIETDPADSADPAEPALPDDQPPIGADPADVPQADDAAAPATASAGDTPAPDQSSEFPMQVAIRFEEDSWTEVNDGNGNSLYYALGMAGVTENFDGVPPLSIMLGNPRGVQVSINDQPYPVPLPQGNATTVRFVVAEAP